MNKRTDMEYLDPPTRFVTRAAPPSSRCGAPWIFGCCQGLISFQQTIQTSLRATSSEVASGYRAFHIPYCLSVADEIGDALVVWIVPSLRMYLDVNLNLHVSTYNIDLSLTLGPETSAKTQRTTVSTSHLVLTGYHGYLQPLLVQGVSYVNQHP